MMKSNEQLEKYKSGYNYIHTLVVNKTYAMPFPMLVPGSLTTRIASMQSFKLLKPVNN
ncbi:hypothetical protein Hanom_Chr13g01221611 [Helianthus anomalus]